MAGTWDILINEEEAAILLAALNTVDEVSGDHLTVSEDEIREKLRYFLDTHPSNKYNLPTQY